MLGDFQPAQRQRLKRARTTGYLRSPYQRGGMFLGPDPYDRDPTRLSPGVERQLGGTLMERAVRMGKTGPSPRFLKLGSFMGKRAVQEL